jgi:hypothetical protein
MFPTKFVEKSETYILCPKTFLFEKLADYETTWKNTLVPDKPQMTIRCMRIEC